MLLVVRPLLLFLLGLGFLSRPIYMVVTIPQTNTPTDCIVFCMLINYNITWPLFLSRLSPLANRADQRDPTHRESIEVSGRFETNRIMSFLQSRISRRTLQSRFAGLPITPLGPCSLYTYNGNNNNTLYYGNHGTEASYHTWAPRGPDDPWSPAAPYFQRL